VATASTATSTSPSTATSASAAAASGSLLPTAAPAPTDAAPSQPRPPATPYPGSASASASAQSKPTPPPAAPLSARSDPTPLQLSAAQVPASSASASDSTSTSTSTATATSPSTTSAPASGSAVAVAAVPAPPPGPGPTPPLTAPPPSAAAPGLLQATAAWNCELALTKCRVHLLLMDTAFEVLSGMYSRFTATTTTSAAASASAEAKDSPFPAYRVSRAAVRSAVALVQHTRSISPASASSPRTPPLAPASAPSASASASPPSPAPAPAPSGAGAFDLDSKAPVTLSASHLLAVVQALNACVAFARAFHSDKELRRRLQAAGLMRKPSAFGGAASAAASASTSAATSALPELYVQEARALKFATSLLLKLFGDEAVAAGADPDLHHTDAKEKDAFEDAGGADVPLSEAEARLMAMQSGVLHEYIARARRADSEESEGLVQLSGAVCALLDGFLQFTTRQFATHVTQFYPLWMELVAVGSVEVRAVLRKLLLSRVGAQLLALAV
jgi:hypothetical protein